MLECYPFSQTISALNECQCVLPRRDSDRFPDMQRWRAEVAAAEKGLADLLPAYRRQLQISSVQVGRWIAECRAWRFGRRERISWHRT